MLSEHPEKRICPWCPEMKFKGLEDHADHLAEHNPSPAVWAEAYKRIQAGKQKAKARPE